MWVLDSFRPLPFKKKASNGFDNKGRMNVKPISQPISGSYLISKNEAAKRLGVHRRTLEREVSRNHFPRPLKIGAKSLYAVSEVEAYVRRLMEQRDAMA